MGQTKKEEMFPLRSKSRCSEEKGSSTLDGQERLWSEGRMLECEITDVEQLQVLAVTTAVEEKVVWREELREMKLELLEMFKMMWGPEVERKTVSQTPAYPVQ